MSLIKIDPLRVEEEKIKKVAEVLSRGGLVIVPTETVYGIVVNSYDEMAVKRLYQIKERPFNKPFTIIIERKERIEEFAQNISSSVYKLIDVFWPGPLTVIIPKENLPDTVGLRMPHHSFLLKLITEVKFPLYCPSANISGRPPPRTLEEALRDLKGKVDLAVDGGPASLGIESTIVDLTKEPFSIIREGAIPKEKIEEVKNKKIVLFVCTGNSCRSVMAEALLKKRLKEMNRTDVEVISAGIANIGSLKPTLETIELLKSEGIDVSGYNSKSINPLMIKKADLIFVMESIHEKRIRELAPYVKNNLFLLKEFAKIEIGDDLEIPDPIGKSKEYYDDIFRLIKEAVERIANII
ncbi:MAG: L-threonylcarbamoyladenylate synthase [Candidatus Omnitrophica bacterium]|nr:L-threonylcarbamoyladenylate synthase [Candidatus Omnitrophota bacterium]